MVETRYWTFTTPLDYTTRTGREESGLGTWDYVQYIGYKFVQYMYRLIYSYDRQTNDGDTRVHTYYSGLSK